MSNIPNNDGLDNASKSFLFHHNFPIKLLLRNRLSYIIDSRRIYMLLPTPLRIRFWVIMCLSFLCAVVESLAIVVIALFAQSVASPGSVRSMYFYQWLQPYLPDYIAFRLSGDRTLITTMCLLVMLFMIAKNIIVCITLVYSNIFSENVGVFVSFEAYSRYFSRDYFWHISDQSKDLIARIDHRGELTSLTTSLMQMFGNIFCTLIMFTVLFIISPVLTFIVIALFSVVSIVSYVVLRKKIDSAGNAVGRLDGQRLRAVRIATRGIREIITYRKQDVFLNNIIELIRKAIPYKTFLATSGHIPGWLLEVSGFVIIFGVMLYLVANGAPMPQVISAISMLLLTAWRVLPLVSRSMGLAVHIRSIRSRAYLCMELLEGFSNETHPQIPSKINKDGILIGNIELNNVSFRYHKSSSETIKDVTFTIEQGENVGIIGRSGAGKSTLALILAGLLSPQSGSMLVNNHHLVGAKLASYRKFVGYVPQNPLLLPGTIAENVALSDWGKEHDLSRIEKVCKQAAMEFISNGTKNLSFVIGDGGEGLSGGEGQRVSIARALYTDPAVIVLDEATSSLDINSEKAIVSAINALNSYVTTIVIAHRLSTVEHCDKVIWMENGRIKEQGPPDLVIANYLNHKP